MTTEKLAPGMPAPDFELPADNGKLVKLSDFRGKRVILYFYPKDNTSGCTNQACGFRDSYPVIEEHNGIVLGISTDSVESHQKFKTKNNLPFTLLVDADHAVAETYGVWGEKKMYGKSYMGIIRSHFVIDEAGIIIERNIKISPADSVKHALQSIKK